LSIPVIRQGFQVTAGVSLTQRFISSLLRFFQKRIIEVNKVLKSRSYSLINYPLINLYISFK